MARGIVRVKEYGGVGGGDARGVPMPSSVYGESLTTDTAGNDIVLRWFWLTGWAGEQVCLLGIEVEAKCVELAQVLLEGHRVIELIGISAGFSPISP